MFKAMIKSEVNRAVAIARSAFPHASIPMPDIEFSTRMTKVGGKCKYYYGHYTLRFSLDIMERNDIDKYISQVVYHEVAHMVDKQVYGNWGHGATFYRIMRVTFGKRGQEASRTHRFETAPTVKRKVKRYNYRCPDCNKVLTVSAIRHGKIRNGTRNYTHCSKKIVYIGEAISV